MLWCWKLILVTTWMLHRHTGHAQEWGDCGGNITGQSSGFVHSPNYPGRYSNNLDCTWTIEVNEWEGVSLTPVSFNLEENFDWLGVYKKGVDNFISLGLFTGTNFTEKLVAWSHTIRLVFRTDYSYSEDGFKIHFEGNKITEKI
ncbi:CUB and sushi domain-containing protein 3-like [Branchiostoma floridae]|uniref:CUB and sushi domain-containing protein 3-like n=1 Tax=Branchiostoma floridae TaxID=7739 RepID=A0A9J7HS09_BRAFL|nr:CUB and sushi domain-containing protein 3-like [Branchiostoma floridae]